MPMATHSVQVAAPVETLWRLLVDEMEKPGRYLPGVEESEVLERKRGQVVRRMRTPAFEVVERVTASEKRHEVDHVLLDHPLYTGTMVNRIEPPSRPGQAPRLTFTLDWQRKDGEADGFDMSKSIRQAVERTKVMAEAATDGRGAHKK